MPELRDIVVKQGTIPWFIGSREVGSKGEFRRGSHRRKYLAEYLPPSHGICPWVKEVVEICVSNASTTGHVSRSGWLPIGRPRRAMPAVVHEVGHRVQP